MSLFEFEGIQLDPDRFVTEEAFEDSLEGQENIAFFALEHLALTGNEPGVRADVDFFFNTNTKEKADIFVTEMSKKGFHICLSTPRPPQFLFSLVVTKPNVVITEEGLTALAREMCKIGYIFDCLMEGWGMGFISEVDGDLD
jgi:Regulator of ribonuclease activity B